MGLRGAEDHAPAAFAASVFDSKSLSQSLLGEPPAADGDEAEERPSVLPPRALVALSVTLGEDLAEEEVMGLRQRKLGEKVDLHLHRRLLQSLEEEDEREKARLSSLTLPHVGDWLNVAPVKTLGLHLRSAEFVLVAKYRLGLPVFARDGPCPACFRPSDALGDHAMCCGFGGERISRHNHLRDALYETAVAAGLGPVKEGRRQAPCRHPGAKLGWGERCCDGRDSGQSPTGSNCGRGSCHTWSRPHLCIPEKTARSCRGLQEGEHSFPALGSGVLGRLALGCGGGGEEARSCACQAERAGGGRGAAPTMGETSPSAAARQCCNLGQPSAHAPSPCSGRIPLNCTTQKQYLECTPEHCPTIP